MTEARDLTPALYSLEQIWAWFGERMCRVARRRLPDDATVAVVVSHVMERAALDLARCSNPPIPADLGAWLMRLVRDACEHPPPAHSSSSSELSMTTPPVSRRVRMYYWVQLERRRRLQSGLAGEDSGNRPGRHLGLAPVVLLLRQLRARWDGVSAHGRAMADRALQLAHGPPGLSGFVTASALPALTEAAAVMVAAVALALAGPGTAAAMATGDAARAATGADPTPTASLADHSLRTAVLMPPADPTSVPHTAESGRSSTAVNDPPATAPLAPVAPSVSAVGAPAVEPEEPRVESTHYEGGESTYYTTPRSEPITADVEGDGDEDVRLGVPYVGVECGPPDERPPIWEEGCSLLEEHDDAF